MNIPKYNAFTINRLGPGGLFFPLCCNLSQKGDVTRAFLCAQRVIDICDVIERNARDNLVLYDVQHYISDGGDYKIIPFERVAHKFGIHYSPIASDTIVLEKEELKALLLGLNHDNLYTFDIGEKWCEDEVIGQVITCLDRPWQSEEYILPKLASSNFFAHSHDDCYLTIETYNPSFVKQIFSRMLQIFTGTILGENDEDIIDIAELPEDILAQFWEKNFNLTILSELTQIEKQGVWIGIDKKAFEFGGNAEYIAESWLHYDLSTRQWLFVKPS